ncbi:F-box/kelch-repeat protein At3g06240 [Linum grandiflorum]
MSDYIPQDVLTRILLRLPVKSLLRFRSISKSLNSTISSPVFVSLYSDHHLRRRPTHFLFSMFFGDYLHAHLLYDQILTFHPDPDNNSFPATNDEQIPWPFPRNENFNLVGSSNGLLCIFFRQSRALCLWNPAIRKHITLDPPPMEMVTVGSRMNRFTAFMFGFAAGEYKIATIEVSYAGGQFITYNGGGTDMYIYELSKNSWKKKNTDSNSAPVRSNGSGHVWYNGGVHWIGKNYSGEQSEENRRWKVICFDMGNECYREMRLPEEASSDNVLRFLSLTVTETASLGLVHFDGWNNTKCWVWAMEDYGEATSWKKMFTVDFTGKLSSVMRLVFREKKEKNERGMMIVLTEDMEVVSFDGGDVMIWVDQDGRRGKIAAVHNYRESLALL